MMIRNRRRETSRGKESKDITIKIATTSATLKRTTLFMLTEFSKINTKNTIRIRTTSANTTIPGSMTDTHKISSRVSLTTSRISDSKIITTIKETETTEGNTKISSTVNSSKRKERVIIEIDKSN